MKIISGGQTGVDRAALDVALELGIPCGGYCPKGRKAEDGPIDHKYPLQETGSGDYRVRTEMNVKESNGTLILSKGRPSGGTALTVKMAAKHSKPCIVVDLDEKIDFGFVRQWIEKNDIAVLNVAGPRGSKNPTIHNQAMEFLKEIFS